MLNFWLCQEIRIFTPRTNPQAALSLRESYMLKAPSAKLSGKDKAAVVAKELGDFLGHYKRETELFTVFREESGMIPRHIFEEFVAFASDSGYLSFDFVLLKGGYRKIFSFIGPVGHDIWWENS